MALPFILYVQTIDEESKNAKNASSKVSASRAEHVTG